MIKIAIHSAPRSGSSWLGQIFNSHPRVAYRFQPLFSYRFKNRLTEKSTSNQINDFFEDIFKTRDRFVLQKANGRISDSNNYKFIKKGISHIVYKEVRYHYLLENMLQKSKDLKVIGLIRNPYAVINSWLRAPREFRNDLGWKELDEWKLASAKNDNKKEEYNGFEKWIEITRLFRELHEKFSEQVYLISYNALLMNTEEEITELFNFCNLKLTESTIDFINISKSRHDNDTYGIHRNKINDDSWKKTLNPKIISKITKELRDNYNDGLISKFI